jgi:hypothetical protein
VRIYDLLLGPPPCRARLADCLDDVVRQHRVERAAQREATAELEAMWTLATRVWDLVLDSANGLYSLVASLSMAVELLECQIDSMATNGVHWETRSVLVAPFSIF